MEDFENREEENPNNIGEVFPFAAGDIETFPNRVYRSVVGRGAIDDLLQSGIVRSKQAAGVVEASRRGQVYWSRGAESKYHNVQPGGYLIEAPYSIASERRVTIDDLTALYHKADADAAVEDVLDQTLRDSLQ